MRIAGAIVIALLVVSPLTAQTVPVLVIDGAKTTLATAEGGAAWSEVISERIGPDHVMRKHIAGVKYEPLRLSFSPNQCTVLYSLISDTFAPILQRRSGNVFLVDRRGAGMSKLAFMHAPVGEVRFPGTAEPGEPWLIGVTLLPEYTSLDRHATEKLTDVPPVPSPVVNGRVTLSLSGLPSVDVVLQPVVVVNQVFEPAVGEMRDYEREPAVLTIPEIRAVIPESAADPFFAWHRDFLVLGNNAQDREKIGTLSYRSVNGQALFDVTLQNVGISGLRAAPEKGGYEVTLYVEKMGITSAYTCTPQ